MADLKISQMTDGGLVETTDELPVNRGGQNFKVKFGSAASYEVGGGDSELPTGQDVQDKIDNSGFIAFEQDSSGEDFYPNGNGGNIQGIKIPVSATDQLSEYLEDKLSAGTNISITKIQDSSGVEYLEISSTGSSSNLINGNVQLRDNSGTPTLYPMNGGHIIVNGNQYVISSPIALTNNSPVNDTTYYVYLEENGSGGLNLIHSTTSYTFNSSGIPVMTGDSTKTFVGVVRRLTGAWATTDNLLRSWYNRNKFSAHSFLTTNRNVTTTTYSEIHTELKIEFINFSDEVINFYPNAITFNSNASTNNFTSVAIDSTTVAEDTYASGTTYAGGSGAQPHNPILSKKLTEGYHYATLLGRVSANTGTWFGSNTAGARTTFYITN